MGFYDFTAPFFLKVADGGGLAKASYALRKLHRRATKAVRVKDDTGTESDIGFVGDNLDTTGLVTTFLQRDLVASVPLGTDGDADGVSDGWTKTVEAGITATHSIDDSAQKIEITNSTNTSKSWEEKTISCVPGTVISANATIKKSGAVSARILFYWFNGTTFLSSETTTSADDEYSIKSLTNKIAPANTTKCVVLMSINPLLSGNTGSAWFKDASVTISNQSAYVTTWYDQSGNNNHAVQATAANQPRIVNAGVLEVGTNGKPTLYFDGVNHRLSISNLLLTSNLAGLHITSVARDTAPTAGGDATHTIFASENTLGTGRAVLRTRDLNGGNVFQAGGRRVAADSFISAISNNNGEFNIIEGSFDYANSGTIKLYINGILKNVSAQFANGAGNTDSAAVAAISIGTFNTGAGDFIGNISELILFGTTLTDVQRNNLEKNQGKYYGITVA